MGQLQQCTVIIVRSVSVVFVSLSLSLSLSVSQLVLLLTQARGKPEGRRRMQPGCAGQRDGLRPGQGGQGGAGGGRGGRVAWDCIILLRVAHHLKLMDYFLEFSIQYFWTAVDHRSVKPWTSVGLLYSFTILPWRMNSLNTLL